MIAREELYRLVWSEPITKVAARFDVSGSYLTRICALLNVPRPAMGHWAKLAVGKAPPIAPLPDARAGDQLYWSREGGIPPAPRPERPTRRKKMQRVHVPATHTHGLLRGATAHFENVRKAGDDGYLRPYKKLLVDVRSSNAGLKKALSFANVLFNSFESLGYRVVLAPENERFRPTAVDSREVRGKRLHEHYVHMWSPQRSTVVYVGTVAVGLTVVEMSESVLLRYVGGKYIREADYVPPKASRYQADHSWTTTRDVPSNRLRLMAYSPYWGSGWTAQWQETGSKALDPQISSIVAAVVAAADEIVSQLEESERRAEIARQAELAAEERRRREEDIRRVAHSVSASHEHLQQIIKQWTDIVAVEDFFAGVEVRAANLQPEDRDLVFSRLALARQLLGIQDPLAYFLSWKAPEERYKTRYPDEGAPGDGGQTLE